MQKLASDQNKSKRQSFFDVAIFDCDHRDCLAGDKLQKDIFKWLSPPDPWKNHHIACKSRHRGSAEWFIQGNTFLEWKASKDPSSSLWIYGKRPLMSISTFFRRLIIFLCSGCRKKRVLVRQSLDILVSGTYRVGQLRNHRGHRFHAKSWAHFTRLLLLRFQGRRKDGPPRIALVAASSALSSI